MSAEIKTFAELAEQDVVSQTDLINTTLEYAVRGWALATYTETMLGKLDFLLDDNLTLLEAATRIGFENQLEWNKRKAKASRPTNLDSIYQYCRINRWTQGIINQRSYLKEVQQNLK